jgi:hypothetical protein
MRSDLFIAIHSSSCNKVSYAMTGLDRLIIELFIHQWMADITARLYYISISISLSAMTYLEETELLESIPSRQELHLEHIQITGDALSTPAPATKTSFWTKWFISIDVALDPEKGSFKNNSILRHYPTSIGLEFANLWTELVELVVKWDAWMRWIGKSKQCIENYSKVAKKT